MKFDPFIKIFRNLFKKKEEEVNGGGVAKMGETASFSSESEQDTSSSRTTEQPFPNKTNFFSKTYENVKGKSFLKPLIIYLTSIVILSTLGVITGWLVVNSEKTILDREKLRPTLKVNILAEEEGAPKNSSKVQYQEENKDNTKVPKNGGENVQAARAESEEENDDPMVGIIFPHVVEETEKGPLPIIAADGRQPWIEYSRNFKRSDRKPRIALIISNLGLSSTYTAAVLKIMPKNVTLSFSHIAPQLKTWVREARLKGHEILIDLPMEPQGFPENDPGRDTLLTSLNEVENLNRLERIMMRAGAYVGLLSTHGNKFTLNSETLLPILKSIKERGLLFVDSRSTSRSLGPELASTIQLPRAFNNSFLDKEPSIQNILKNLKDLENMVREKKFAVAIAQPLPVSLQLLADWINGLKEKGIALAPITAIADKQSQR